jgi:hypothetical protein
MGCTIDETVGPDAQISCAADSECPAGLVCRAALQRCVKPSGGEQAPALVGQSVVSPEMAKAGTRITVTFDTDTPLGQPARVTAELRSTVLTFAHDPSASSELHHVFAYTTDGTEPEGLARVYADLVDSSGNSASGLPLGTVSLDFTAPAVLSMAVAYSPGPGNPLPLVQKATVDTTVTVTTVADELLALAAVSTPQLSASNGTDTLSFQVVSRTGLSVTFQTRVPPGTSSGSYRPTLSWADLAGNATLAATLPDPAPEILVVTDVPALAVDQSQVRYLRSPWGNGAVETVDGGFTFPAGPYFALAPFEPLSPAGELWRSTFTFSDAGARLSRVRVWAAPDAGALLGTMEPTDAGWPRLALAEVDVSTVYVSGIDEAGNESLRQRIQNAEWVATPLPPAAGTNPHALLAMPNAGPALRPSLTAAVSPAAHGLDGTHFAVRSAPVWRQRDAPNFDSIPGRRGHAMAFDAARGRLVVFGGYGASELGDTWEWDGTSWQDKTPTGARPSARTDTSMAFDAVRGRVVLFGGYDGALSLSDTWEWDGTSWVQQFPPNPRPEPRSAHRLAFDSSRGRVVLFGGYSASNELWEWAGTRWIQLTTTGAKPVARATHGLTYDSVRQRLVLFGGITNGVLRDDVWEWDGTGWADKTPSGTRPSARGEFGFAFDAVRGRAVVFGGGFTNAQDLWEWDGTGWVDRTPAGLKPEGRYRHALVDDPTGNRLLLFGGTSFQLHADLWSWSGTAWTELSPSVARPSTRFRHALAYDPLRERTVLFGGQGQSVLQDTWEWDGHHWTAKPPDGGAQPSPRAQFAMAYAPVRSRVVLFGGETLSGRNGETWEWDGTAWSDRTDAGARPPARFAHAMAYDTARDRLVLFGGYGTVRLGDTWEWNGTDWVERTPDGGLSPSARSEHAMAYDRLRGRTVLFGGYDTSAKGDTWEWDGTGWANKTPDGGTSPSIRFEHGLVWDEGLQRVVLFGHNSALQDAWSWDGTQWNPVVPVGVTPGNRSEHGFAYDAARGRIVLFGGYAGNAASGDTWELDLSPQRTPAAQLEVKGFNLPASWLSGLRVRAWCGGRFAPFGGADFGASLYGWAASPNDAGTVGWSALANNQGGTTPAILDWAAPSAFEATRYFFDPGLSFQCRPSGSAGPGGGEAELALDYLEVRVRYAAP